MVSVIKISETLWIPWRNPCGVRARAGVRQKKAFASEHAT